MRDRARGSRPRVVVVGAGFGGLEVARHLGGAPVQLTVIDRNNYHLFQPLLYQVATADLSVADISAPIRRILRRQRNTTILMGEVIAVDVTARQVLVHDRVGPYDRWMPYDYLVLATGAEQSYFGHPEWERVAPGLKSAASALAIRRLVLAAFEAAELEPDEERQRALLTIVLVGGGPTGVEMAGALAEMAHLSLTRDFRHINPATTRIILIEAQPHILAGFSPSMARCAHEHLEDLGVEVRTGARVQSVDEEGVVIAGERLAAKTVIWCAGVTASPAAAWLGTPRDPAGHVIVEPDLSVPGHPEIFALGDTSALNADGKALPGLAPVALQEGRYVARAIRDRLRGEPTPPFRYRDKGNLAVVGRGFAVADLPPNLRFDGVLGWVVWLAVHLFFLIGFRNRLVVMLQLAWYYVTRQHGARLILLEDEAAPVKATIAERWSGAHTHQHADGRPSGAVTAAGSEARREPLELATGDDHG
jgi:NADH:ubiquinone reductase (H+-translocating)